MPCYDKKLEASRNDFYNDILKTRDVDCVLTSGEVLDMIREEKIDFKTLEESQIDKMWDQKSYSKHSSLFKLTPVNESNALIDTTTPKKKRFTNIENDQLYGTSGGGSGGYLEYVFRYAANELFGVKVEKVVYKPTKNVDLRVAELEVDGKVVLSFATCYGFKNIQNVVRKIKQNKCAYHFIEIMACPGGN